MSAVRTTGALPTRPFEVPSPPRCTRWGFVAVGLPSRRLRARRPPRPGHARPWEVRRDAAPYHVLRFAERVELAAGDVVVSPRAATGCSSFGRTARRGRSTPTLTKRAGPSRGGPSRPRGSDARAALGVRHYGDLRRDPGALTASGSTRRPEGVQERGERTVMRDDADGGRPRQVPRHPASPRRRSVQLPRGVASGRVRWRSRPAPIAADRPLPQAFADGRRRHLRRHRLRRDVAASPSLRSVRGVDARAGVRHGLGCALLAGGDRPCWPTRADGAPRLGARRRARRAARPPCRSPPRRRPPAPRRGWGRWCWGAWRAWPGTLRATALCARSTSQLLAPTVAHPTAECRHVRAGRYRGVCVAGVAHQPVDLHAPGDPRRRHHGGRLGGGSRRSAPTSSALDDGRPRASQPARPARRLSVPGDLPAGQVALVAVDPIERSDGRPVAPHACVPRAGRCSGAGRQPRRSAWLTGRRGRRTRGPPSTSLRARDRGRPGDHPRGSSGEVPFSAFFRPRAGAAARRVVARAATVGAAQRVGARCLWPHAFSAATRLREPPIRRGSGVGRHAGRSTRRPRADGLEPRAAVHGRSIAFGGVVERRSGRWARPTWTPPGGADRRFAVQPGGRC